MKASSELFFTCSAMLPTSVPRVSQQLVLDSGDSHSACAGSQMLLDDRLIMKELRGIVS